MSRFVNLSVLIIGILFTLQLWGVQQGTLPILGFFEMPTTTATTSYDLGSLGSFTTFTSAVIRLLLLASAASIIIGLITRTSFEFVILAGASALILLLNGNFLYICTQITEPWIQYLLYPILGILSVLYIYSAIEFVFNR